MEPSWWVKLGTGADRSPVIALGARTSVPPNVVGHLILAGPLSLWLPDTKHIT